jgi:hypothetical protein
MKTLILSLVLFLLLSCTNNDDNQSVTNLATPITFTLIGKNSISNPSPLLQNVLIANQTQWNTLLTSMNAVNIVSTNFSETNINFNNFDVIAVFRSPISNSASTVDIISIEENYTNRIVSVQNLINGDATDVAQPFHIVKIPKSTKPVVFQ